MGPWQSFCVFSFVVLLLSVRVCSRRCRPMDLTFDNPLEPLL